MRKILKAIGGVALVLGANALGLFLIFGDVIWRFGPQ